MNRFFDVIVDWLYYHMVAKRWEDGHAVFHQGTGGCCDARYCLACKDQYHEKAG
jgi:hypothetical protein